MDITITMNEDEIVTAIKDYLNTQDVPTAGKEVEVNMVAGRGANGHSAVISVKKEVDPIKQDMAPVEKPVAAAKPAPEKKKETPAPVAPPVAAGLFTEPVEPVEACGDENSVTEGDAEALFADEPGLTPATTQQVDSLFN